MSVKFEKKSFYMMALFFSLSLSLQVFLEPLGDLGGNFTLHERDGDYLPIITSFLPSFLSFFLF